MNVEIDLLDFFDLYAFSVKLRTAIYGWVNYYATWVGLKSILLNLPCTTMVIILLDQSEIC